MLDVGPAGDGHATATSADTASLSRRLISRALGVEEWLNLRRIQRRNKIVSQLADTRAFNALHKKYIDAGEHIAAATYYRVPGMHGLSHLQRALPQDGHADAQNFRTAVRFSLGLHLPKF